MSNPEQRRERLKGVYEQARTCQDCVLAETRTTVVFGAGNANADLMFVGEAPGKTEDERGLPFVGQAGKLLDTLLSEIGLQRADVFIANTLKCRPPGNRDPYPGELEACRKYLFSQIELIEPTMIATLGNFATKLLRGDNTGITQIHGQAEERVIGPRAVRLYPLLHPAAALYTRAMVDVLREDFARIPALLAMGPPPQPEPGASDPAPPEAAGTDPAPPEAAGSDPAPPEAAASGPEPARRDPGAPESAPPSGGDQLGLF